jgi:hypothetical protein
VVKQELIERGFFVEDKFIDETKSLNFLINNISYEILGRCDATDSATNLWNWLKFEFNNANPYALKLDIFLTKYHKTYLQNKKYYENGGYLNR